MSSSFFFLNVLFKTKKFTAYQLHVKVSKKRFVFEGLETSWEKEKVVMLSFTLSHSVLKPCLSGTNKH